MLKKLSTVFLCSFILVCTHTVNGGITGSVSGQIFDKETSQTIPGASIVIEGTTLGATANKNGFFMIHNLPAGTYDVSARMIGYSNITITEVRINVDLNTRLDFQLSSKVLDLEEIVIVKGHQLIQSEVTSSTYFISGEEINEDLAIDSYQDAISILPGVVGNHIRGGRETDVLYMLDGLPLQGAVSREISSYFPNSSIVEMMVQTGGFTAEYGHAGSGIVNVVSQNGGNKFDGNFKIYTDFFDTGLTDNENTRRLDLNLSGPISLTVGPVNNAKYFVSGDLNLSDTSFREKMSRTFDSPIFTNYNINSKISFGIGGNTTLALQGLLSNWKWRRFNPQWEFNLQGLAEHQHYSNRISASLTHTFSPRFFTTLKVARYAYKREVLGDAGGEKPRLVFEDANDPSSPILIGREPWEERSTETSTSFKWDLVMQVASNHLVKTGIDFQKYNLDFENSRFSAVSRKGGLDGIQYNKLSNDFNYSPQFFAIYIQDKYELNGITANLGLRYDVFNPESSINELPDAFEEIRTLVHAPTIETRTPTHNPLSPRLGISLPLSENERVHVNYGWFYKMPPLYYLYTNLNYNLDSYLPIFGSLDLKPVKTIASEISYKRTISDDILLVVTGFIKQFDNLIDTQTFKIPEKFIEEGSTAVGFAKYSNSGSGTASGFEVTLQKRITSELSGRVSYTYMKAKGTSSAAEDEHNFALLGAKLPSDLEFPLSWDQRHSFVFDARFQTGALRINALYRIFSPLPVTTPGSTIPNDSRLSWRNILDIKIRLNNNFFRGHMKPFVEIRNLFDQKNIINQFDNTGVRAYRLFDPINSDSGRRLRIGMNLEF